MQTERLFEIVYTLLDRGTVTAQALADKLPAQFARQTQRIWKRWLQNRERLEKIYPLLPRSVFQADINHTNCLLDEDRNFRGVYDFNIAGSEVFINYLIREIPYVMTTDAFDASKVDDYALKSILHAIEVSKKVYRFNDLEKRAAIMIYRCVKPIWFTEVENLRRAGGDSAAIAQCLDKTEFIQTRDIDFAGYMS